METSEARVFLILSADQSVLTSSTGQPNSYYLELENGNESSSMNRKTCREACSSRCNFSSVYQMKVIKLYAELPHVEAYAAGLSS